MTFDNQKHIICTVSNDLSTDQRMHRICGTLVDEGYAVTLVGRELKASSKLVKQKYSQVRLKCRFNSGPLFYLEFNYRLFRYLQKSDADLINSIDLDTLLAGRYASNHLGIPLVFDAHEYFSEVPELLGRPIKKWIWNQIGYRCVPLAKVAYTVNDSLGKILTEKYGRKFEVIRNLPEADTSSPVEKEGKRLIYQGVLNQGRCIEYYIDILEQLDEEITLHIYGEGDLSSELRLRAKQSLCVDRILFHGKMSPQKLRQETKKAWIGLNLLEGESLNYTYSLANKFFDYMNAGIPSINSPFPEYKHIIEEDSIGLLSLKEELVDVINELHINEPKYGALLSNINKVKEKYLWAKESKRLVEIYHNVIALNIKPK